jgi:integrase
MGLKLRGGVWHIDLYHEGQRIRESTGTSDRKLAELRLKEKEVGLWKGTETVANKAVPPHLRTLGGYFDRAWSIHFRNLKAGENVRAHWAALLRHLPPSTPLASLSEASLSEAAGQMLDAGAGPATVNRRYNVLRTVLRLAAAESPPVLARVPKVPRMREPEGRLRFLNAGELQQVETMLTVDPGPLADEVFVLLDTGMRLGELLSLTSANVDLVAKRVSLWDTKSGRRRWMPLTQRASTILAERMAGGGGRLFPRPARDMQREWRLLCETMGWQDVVLHTLRHTYATRLLAGGLDVRTVAALMGHSSIQTTMRYAHAVDSRLTSALSVLEGGVPGSVTTLPTTQDLDVT